MLEVRLLNCIKSWLALICPKIKLLFALVDVIRQMKYSQYRNNAHSWFGHPHKENRRGINIA